MRYCIELYTVSSRIEARFQQYYLVYLKCNSCSCFMFRILPLSKSTYTMSGIRVTGIGFFKDKTIEVLPDCEVFEISSSLGTVRAFHELVKHGVHSAPVYDSAESRYIGVFDMADMLVYVLSTLHRTSETDEVLPDELTTNLIDILAWVNRLVPDSATDVTNLSKRNPFVTINADATLLDAMVQFGQKGVKRLAVVDSVSGKVTKYITQSGLGRVLQEHEDAVSGFGTETIHSKKLGFIDVKTVNQDAPAVRAFELMEKFKVGGIGVVNSSGVLVGSLSDTDLRAMFEVPNFRLYGLTVSQLLAKLGHTGRVFTVPPTAQLRDAFAQLNEHRVHRLYIIDEQGKPIGVVTYKQLLQQLHALVKRVEF
eukprot:m.241569 g.241569  ORF g.241569 m.241569 type:complete len:367 (+) comp15327_c0_seq5:116-1216(+)